MEPIRAGDTFTFNGLPGEPFDKSVTLIVRGISTAGAVAYVIRREGFEPSLHSIDYLTLKALIADGIWEPL
jgi:hypothetical protein